MRLSSITPTVRFWHSNTIKFMLTKARLSTPSNEHCEWLLREYEQNDPVHRPQRSKTIIVHKCFMTTEPKMQIFYNAALPFTRRSNHARCVRRQSWYAASSGPYFCCKTRHMEECGSARKISITRKTTSSMGS